MPVYEKYRDGYFVSISDSDRAPGLNYLATVYNGIDLSLYPLQESGGDDLVFLGRIHPDKGVHLAIEVARLSGRRLIIAGIIQDESTLRNKSNRTSTIKVSVISGRWASRKKMNCLRAPAR